MFDHLDTISRLSSIYIHIGPDLIGYTLTTINYPSCQQISVSYNIRVKIIYKEFIYSNQIGSFLNILDTISTLTAIYIHIAQNLIRYTLTTIYYSSCQQISGCYHIRVQIYSQRIYIQQSNWVIFDHFGHYFQIIFNLYSYCTRFNSIHINYYIIHLVNKFQLVITYECKLIHKEFIYSNQIGSCLTIWTLFPDYLQSIFILDQI